MKKRTVRSRVFLNHPKSDCLAVLGWRVDVEKTIDWDSVNDDQLEDIVGEGKDKKKPRKWDMSADMNISDDAKSHYVNRKADMKAVYKMQKELARFITECEKAFKDVENANAKS